MPEILHYLTNLGALELIGVGGFIFYFCSFGALQFGLLDGNSIAYSLVTVIAASMVAASLIAEFNLPSALIQGSWITMGIIGLALRWRRAWPTFQTKRTPPLEAEVF